MAKLTLNDIVSQYGSVSLYNSNNTAIEETINDKVLFRDNPTGEANQMENLLDMNSNKIINLPQAASGSEPVTLNQLLGYASGDIVAGTVVETWTATASQVLFTITTSQYVLGANNLKVYVDGILQTGSYTETSTTSFTFDEAPGDGSLVVAIINEAIASGDIVSGSNVQITINGTTYNLSEYLGSREVESYSALRTLLDNLSVTTKDTVSLSSDTNTGINGSGVIVAATGSEYADNGGTIIVANGGTSTAGMLVWLRNNTASKVLAESFGVETGAADNTDELQAAIDSFGANSGEILLPPGVINVRGLDLSAGNVTLVGNNGNEYCPTNIDIIGSPIYDDGAGNSVAILLNDSLVTGVRGPALVNINVREGSNTDPANGMRYWGIYGQRVPFTKLNQVLTYGFNVGCYLEYQWDCSIDEVNCYHFRTGGFSVSGMSSSFKTNGMKIGTIHCSSDQSPDWNFNFGGSRSIGINTLVSEGNQAAHIKADGRLDGLTILNIHKEGPGDFITYDLDGFASTYPRGAISILGGIIFDCGGVGERFLKTTGSTANVGLRQLTLGPVQISKNSAIEADYFDMSRCGILDTQATFYVYSADAAIDSYTWKNVGADLSKSYKKYQLGHDGRINAPTNKGIYTGVPNESISYVNESGATVTSATPILDVPALATEVTHEIDVEVNYNSGAFSGRRFWARFLVFQTVDDTIVQKLVSSEDNYALDCVFSLNVVNQQLEVTNATGFGTFYFKIKTSTQLPG